MQPKLVMRDKWGSESGRTVYETLLVILMVGILLGVAIDRFLDTVTVAKETALKSELANIRGAVRLYHMLNKRYPDELRALVEEEYIFPFREESYAGDKPMIKRYYIEKMSVDREGNILDPFHVPYRYDSRSGVVRSGTEGYERW